MAKNYTPLDLKKLKNDKKNEPAKTESKVPDQKQDVPKKSGSKIDAILIGIIVITLVVLGVLLFMLYQKSI